MLDSSELFSVNHFVMRVHIIEPTWAGVRSSYTDSRLAITSWRESKIRPIEDGNAETSIESIGAVVLTLHREKNM